MFEGEVVEHNPLAIVGFVVVGALTFYLGLYASRLAHTTPDFLVARRTVRSRRNAAAISGSYLSAASFLGVAGLILKDGADALWYPVGFAGGFLALLLFVAAPLRRSGAYTLPDFAEARLGSPKLRTVCTVFVIVIGFFYLVPQLQGAQITLHAVIGLPPWAGVVLTSVLMLASVLGGGMRAVTLVQAFQYWVKLFAIAAPTFVLCGVLFANPAARGVSDTLGPEFTRDTTVTLETPVTLRVGEPVTLSMDGESVDGFPTQRLFWAAGTTHELEAGTTLRFPKGSPVPVVDGAPPDNESWLRPSSDGAVGLLATYSLLFALFAGTMGLPHVLVRLYTNPTGSAARRTTLHVLLQLGVFYLFPMVLGVLGRLYTPQLLVTGNTDASILVLPLEMLGGVWGQIVAAVIAAGAFAAFLSTSSGLLLGVAGVLSTDVLPGRVRDFRLATVVSAVLPMVMALLLPKSDLSITVGMSFALAASTFCPLLVLGIWWRRLTWTGAMAGMIVGGGLVCLALALNIVAAYTGNWSTQLMLQPALITVPAAFLVAVVVSRFTKGLVPADVNAIMMRLHSPDRLGFIQDRDVMRFGKVDERARMAHGKHRA